MQFAKISIFSILAFAYIAPLDSGRAFANNVPRHCYNFTFTELPLMESLPAPRTELWCYQSTTAPASGLYIYNADNSQVRPELAFVKTDDGILTHGSLLAGKITMHSVRSRQFNPFSVPLDEPHNLPVAALDTTKEFDESAAKVLAQLLQAKNNSPGNMAISTGTLTEETSAQPWRGYWWPYKGIPLAGPLKKFDVYLRVNDIGHANAVSWERQNHADHHIWWEGHCNGWAASAILRAEPRSARSDSSNASEFSVSDQKGLLAELDYCANSKMFGHRGARSASVSADVFHKALVYYIGQLHKPIAMDYRTDAAIDNHVVSGYTMNIERNSGDSVTVTAKLRVHGYDGFRSDVPGIAPPYTRTYRYTLQTDENGIVSSGTWLGDRPGFLWAPLSPGRCSDGNPNLHENDVGSILGR